MAAAHTASSAPNYNNAADIQQLNKLFAAHAPSTAPPGNRVPQEAQRTLPVESPSRSDAPEQGQPQQITPEDDGYRPHDEGAEDEGSNNRDDTPPLTMEEGREMLQVHYRNNATQNKENAAPRGLANRPRSLLDRQSGAGRVSWDEPSQGRSQGPSSSQRPPSPSQDEGFRSQPDVPARNNSNNISPRKRKTPPTMAAGPSSRRTPLTEVSPEAAARRSEARDEEGTQRLTQAQMIKIANRQAKLATQQRNIDHPKPPQKRTAWSAEEEVLLMESIQKYGVQWAKIKREDMENDNIFHRRDQVGLKDKARNMYFDFLK